MEQRRLCKNKNIEISGWALYSYSCSEASSLVLGGGKIAATADGATPVHPGSACRRTCIIVAWPAQGPLDRTTKVKQGDWRNSRVRTTLVCVWLSCSFINHRPGLLGWAQNTNTKSCPTPMESWFLLERQAQWHSPKQMPNMSDND